MNAAFTVLRFTADIARNEPVNIGLIGYYEGHTAVVVDDAAVKRVLATNPELPQEAVIGIAEQVSSALKGERIHSLEAAESVISENVYFPLSTTRFMPFTLQPSLAEKAQHDLEAALGTLSVKLVKPKRRPSKSRGQSPREAVKRRLDPFIKQRKVTENFKVKGGKSGDERQLAFFANHGSDVGLEIVELPSEFSFETLKMRADALAFEADDILSSPDKIGSLVIYVPADRRGNLDGFPAMARERVKNLKNVTVYDFEGAAISKFLADAQISLDEAMVAD